MVKTITTDLLKELGVHKGDSLLVLEEQDGWALVRVDKSPNGPEANGCISDWIRHARGSVRLGADETVDSVKLAYLARKHGIE